MLLDHGLYEHVPEKTRQTLCNFWESMVLRNDNSLKTFANDLNVEGKYLLLYEGNNIFNIKKFKNITGVFCYTKIVLKITKLKITSKAKLFTLRPKSVQ